MADERKQVVVRLPVPLIQRIGHLAVETGQSKQDTIEQLLTIGLEALKQPTQSAQQLWAVQAMRGLKTEEE